MNKSLGEIVGVRIDQLRFKRELTRLPYKPFRGVPVSKEYKFMGVRSPIVSTNRHLRC